MPASRNRLVRVLGHHHRGQGHRQVALQVGQHQFVVVASRQQVIRRGRETYRPGTERISSQSSPAPSSHLNSLITLSTTHLISEAWGLKHWIGRLPRMSYSTHELSSCPDTRRRPEGSTETAATGEPCLEPPGAVTGVTTFTQPRVLRSQNRTVLSWQKKQRMPQSSLVRQPSPSVLAYL